MTAGELLRAARRRHGLTQRQLAIRARTSQAAISRVERDLVYPVGLDARRAPAADEREELVLDAREVDWGHDVTLNRANLALTVAERIDRVVPYARLARELEVAGRGG